MLLESQIREVYDYQANYLEQLPLGTPREILENIDLSDSHITILTGIRRCGKSTVLLQLKNKIQNFSYFSFEDPRLALFEVNDFFKLENVFAGENNVYLFDEIQNVEGWERYVRVLHDQKKKVVLTGSNARILSRELGTSLTGRQITHDIFPFSYREYLQHRNLKPGIESFGEYFLSGGFPEYISQGKRDALLNLYNDLIYRDIVVRHGLRNAKVLNELGVFLATNIGKEFSYNKLAKNFDLGSVNSVRSYISYFEDAYLFFTVSRFSFSVKQQAINPKKVYGIDTGLLSTISLSFSKNKGRLLENLVFIHFRRLGKDVYYFRQKGECDFVVTQDNTIEYAAQVCFELNHDNLDREINGLLEAMNELQLDKGYIFTFNQQDRFEKKGKTLYVQPVWQWMLE